MQRSYYLMRELARCHDVEVVAFRQHAHQPDQARLEEARTALSEFAVIRYVSDLPESRMSGGRPALALRSLLPGPPYTIRWGTCPDYARAVKRAIDEFQPDLIHFDTISLAPYLDLTGSIPAALNHHNIESHMLLLRAAQEKNLLKKLYFWQEGSRLKNYEREVAQRFRLHLVCSDLDGARLEENVGPTSTLTVPNGVDIEYFQPSGSIDAQHADSMVFVGDLTWYPNVSAIRFFLQDVWPLIVRERPGATFRIGGRNPPADVVDISSRDPRVRALGFVDDIRPLVAESMIYVCPIFDGGGTKLKMLDAMAMGKAIVAHPVAAEGLDLIDGQEVLLAEKPDGMARACIRLFDDHTLRANLQIGARRKAESDFSFEMIGRQLAAAYSHIGSPSGRPPTNLPDTKPAQHD